MRWLAEHLEDGEVAYRIGRDGDELVAEWVGLVRLFASRDGRTFRFVTDADAEARDVEKITQGSAQLLLRHLAGHVSLHGAAVAIDGKAVIVLGDSGDGKSTLAASLCARPGVAFLADDAVALDLDLDLDPDGDRDRDYAVVPLERQHWLEPDARGALGAAASGALADRKAPVDARSVAPRSKLVAIVVLGFADVPAPVLTPLRGLATLGALMPQVVRFVIDEPDVQQRELDRIARLVEDVPFLRVERPRRLDLLEATTDAIVSFVRRDLRVPTSNP